MHNLACHHCSKFQTKLTTFFWGWILVKTTQKKPKMTVSAGTKTFENFKLENYRSDIRKT